MRRWLERGRPFDFRSGAPRAGRYPPDSLSAAAAMEAIRPAPVEVGYGFDADLVQVFRHVGSEHEILALRSDDLRAIADGLFLHNHPPYSEFDVRDPRRRAGSFSGRDLGFMTEHGLARMIVVTEERTYVAQRPAGGFYLDADEIAAEYARALSIARARLIRLSRYDRVISREEALSLGRLADEAMLLLARRQYVDYWWEEVIAHGRRS